MIDVPEPNPEPKPYGTIGVGECFMYVASGNVYWLGIRASKSGECLLTKEVYDVGAFIKTTLADDELVIPVCVDIAVLTPKGPTP